MTREGRSVNNGELVAQPDIYRGCERCGVTQQQIEGGYVVVSPTGTAHHGRDYGETWCGIDATGDRWWWPV